MDIVTPRGMCYIYSKELTSGGKAMNTEFFSNNRKRFLDQLEGNCVAFFHSGIAPVKSNDQDMHPFSVNRNFYYLTGIDEQNVFLIPACLILAHPVCDICHPVLYLIGITIYSIYKMTMDITCLEELDARTLPWLGNRVYR